MCVRVWGSILWVVSPLFCSIADSSSQLPVLLFPSAGSDLSQTSWFSCPKSETLNSLLLLCNMLTLTSNFLNLGLQRPHVSSAHFVFHFWETVFCWQVPNGLRIVLLVFQLCCVGGKLDHYPVLIRTGSCVPLYCVSTHFIQVITSWIYTPTLVHTAVILSFPRRLSILFMIASEVCDVVLLYFVDFMDVYMDMQAYCAHAYTYIIY